MRTYRRDPVNSTTQDPAMSPTCGPLTHRSRNPAEAATAASRLPALVQTSTPDPPRAGAPDPGREDRVANRPPRLLVRRLRTRRFVSGLTIKAITGVDDPPVGLGAVHGEWIHAKGIASPTSLGVASCVGITLLAQDYVRVPEIRGSRSLTGLAEWTAPGLDDKSPSIQASSVLGAEAP
jgi:hypothetical protein